MFPFDDVIITKLEILAQSVVTFHQRCDMHLLCLVFCVLSLSCPIIFVTHCGLVTPYNDIDLGQHWLT